eukprot:8400090-Pyramimonas_sp.AAC.1
MQLEVQGRPSGSRGVPPGRAQARQLGPGAAPWSWRACGSSTPRIGHNGVQRSSPRGVPAPSRNS